MTTKKAVMTTLALSFLTAPFLEKAFANPEVGVVEAPAPLQPLTPFHEYTCGDPTLPTAYYFFDIHYVTDLQFRRAYVELEDAKNPRYEENKRAAEQYKKVAEQGLTCQEQIYLTLQQLQQDKKISVGFEEGVHQGSPVEEYSLLLGATRMNTSLRDTFQKYSLIDLVETFKGGLIAFAATQQFPVYGWESLPQKEYEQLAGDMYEKERERWEYYQAHGADATYQRLAKAEDKKLEETDKQRSDAAYDNSLAQAQQWIKEHPEAPRGYVVNIGTAHGNDVLKRFQKEGHPNAVIYVCGE